jgi:hypothetical protein
VANVEQWDHLNVRADPNIPPRNGRSLSNVIYKLQSGTSGIEITDCATNSDWCHIRYKCQEGYVSRQFLAQSTDSPDVVFN